MAGSRLPVPYGTGPGELVDDGTSCLIASPQPGPLTRLASQASWPTTDGAEGLEITLTPLQLAAVLEGSTVGEAPTLSTRLWGAATLVGGALELIGAGALLLAPEPTTVTKVAGGVLGAHGVDSVAAGARQIISGEPTNTLTADGAASLSSLLGADPKTAAMIGVAADVAVPLLSMVGALRVLSVRAGRISLAAEEMTGGHTIARHVGRTEAQLRARLAAQPAIPAASTFRTLAEAEKVVSQALRANKAAILAWSKHAAVGASKAFVYDAGRVVGFGVLRASGSVQTMTRITMVLRRVQQQGRVHFVLTAYPKP
jgi:Bacterial CdiA-CT RNAse A domain